MDKVRLVLYADGKMVKGNGGVSYDKKATVVLSVSRDSSYE